MDLLKHRDVEKQAAAESQDRETPCSRAEQVVLGRRRVRSEFSCCTLGSSPGVSCDNKGL